MVYRGERLSQDQPTIKDRGSNGFLAHSGDSEQTPEAIISHIISGTLDSPFISITRSRRIAERYATNDGVVYEIRLDSTVVLIDPVKVIRAWLMEHDIWSGETYSRAKEAIDLAEEDEELLILVHLPAHTITNSTATA